MSVSAAVLDPSVKIDIEIPYTVIELEVYRETFDIREELQHEK